MTVARAVLDSRFRIGTITRRVFGVFVEHMGRSVYTGIYEPSHPTADADGFRQDVIELVRELGVSTARYPGGNFVSAYRWEDTVGPREHRPRRIDLAWRSVETNEFGLDEFIRWCRKLDIEPMMAVNLGTRGVHEAVDILEYANVPGGTALSDLRAAHGATRPYGIGMWCLGNEMDGPWQTGHKTAHEYGRLAAETARAMRQAHPGLELVVCGSSGPTMETFGSWEWEVLAQTHELVDFISLHFYAEEKDGDLASFLASGPVLDRYLADVVAIADAVAAVKKSPKRIQLSLDEWNVWYQAQHDHDAEELRGWPVAPRIAENQYSVADAVVVGDMLISMVKHADRLTAASLAQLVNVIGAIRTEPGGPAWRQSIFHPFALASRHMTGVSLRVEVDSPSTPTLAHGSVDAVGVCAAYREETGETTLMVSNRSTTQAITLEVDVDGVNGSRVVDSWLLHDDDPYADNDESHPDRVHPHAHRADLIDGTLTVELPPVSWGMIRIAP